VIRAAWWTAESWVRIIRTEVQLRIGSAFMRLGANLLPGEVRPHARAAAFSPVLIYRNQIKMLGRTGGIMLLPWSSSTEGRDLSLRMFDAAKPVVDEIRRTSAKSPMERMVEEGDLIADILRTIVAQNSSGTWRAYVKD
jgi:hypothetical protein